MLILFIDIMLSQVMILALMMTAESGEDVA